MPLKEVALDVADEVAPVRSAIGAANTLLRLPDGTWRAENTDAPGMVDALLAAGVSTVERVGILGAGGTARAALAAARDLGRERGHRGRPPPGGDRGAGPGRGRPRPHAHRQRLGRRRGRRRRRRGGLHRAPGRGRPAGRDHAVAAGRRSCSTPCTTRGRPRWPRSAAAAGLPRRVRPGPAAGPGGPPVRAVHRGGRPGRRDAGRPARPPPPTADAPKINTTARMLSRWERSHPATCAQLCGS